MSKTDDVDFTDNDLLMLARGARALEYVTELFEDKWGRADSYRDLASGLHRLLDELFTDNSFPSLQACIADLLNDEEELIDTLPHARAIRYGFTTDLRSKLEVERIELKNSLGSGPFHDGLVQAAIDKIEAQLKRETA